MDNHPKVCRLCLQVINNPNFELLDALKLAMLKVLPLDINPAYTINALICSQCSDKLQRIFHFKIACLDNNDYLKTFLHCDSSFMLVLEEIIVRNISTQDGIKHEEEKVCRFCLKYFNTELFTELNAFEGNIFFKDILGKCLPELNLNITKDPSICQECINMLQNQFNFVINCLDVDKRIQNFILSDTNNNNNQFVLSVVLKFESKHVDRKDIKLETENDYDNEDISQLVVKKEDMFEDIGESYFQCKIEKDSELNIEHEGTMPEDCIKMEENIKSDLKFEETMSDISQLVVKKEDMFEDIGEPHFQCKIEKDSVLNIEHEGTMLEDCIKMEENIKSDLQSEEAMSDRFELGIVLSQPVGTTRLHRKQECVKPNVECDLSSKLPSKKTRTNKKVAVITMYRCDFCPYVVKYESNLKLHLLLHKDPSEVTMYKCDTCLYQTKDKWELITHYLKHEDPSKVTTYKCASCLYQTKCKGNFNRHRLNHTYPSKLTMYKCDLCLFQTKFKGHHKRHRLKHTDSSKVPMYKCDLCLFQTRHKGNFKIHRLKHKDPLIVEMYKCDFCLYQTKIKSFFKRHLLKHVDPAEITCTTDLSTDNLLKRP